MTTIVETPEEAAIRFSKQPMNDGFELEKLHTYHDPEGNPIYYRLRLKHPNFNNLTSEKQDCYKHSNKWIRPFHSVNGVFKLGEPKFSSGKPPLQPQPTYSRFK